MLNEGEMLTFGLSGGAFGNGVFAGIREHLALHTTRVLTKHAHTAFLIKSSESYAYILIGTLAHP